MIWEDIKDKLRKVIDKPRFGLITDVDGTISPIIDVPDAARVTPENARLLSQLREKSTLVAVVSGRSAEDVAQRVGIPGLVYVGNHGMETWAEGEVRVSAEAEVYRDDLVLALQDVRGNVIEGMRLEDKGATLSVHYRQTAFPEKAVAELTPVMQEIATRHGLVLTQGRMVFEFRPPVNIDKGTAVKDLVVSHKLEAVIFLGDDTTDVSAFQMVRQLRVSDRCLGYGLGVKSQATPPLVLTESDCYVEEVAGVESFLGWVLNSRIASFTC